MTSTLRIVNKQRCNEQQFFDIPDDSLPALKPSSVRIKPRLLGLQGSSNLSYCNNGSRFNWWDTFPVPESTTSHLPPGTNIDEYGIAPCWGFAEVLESNVPGIELGETIWGFMPTHNCPVDLQIERSEHVPDHWIEMSKQRSKLMPLYNRYVVTEDALSPENLVQSAWTAALRSIWECGYLLNRFCFPHAKGDPLLHPMPELGLPWSEQQGDLRNAVVICLGAGGKTSKSFVQQLVANRTDGCGPMGLLEVSSSTKTIVPALKPAFGHRAVEYKDALSAETLVWISDLGASRIVVIDMGSRDNIVEQISHHLHEKLPEKEIEIIGVGGEMQVSRPEDTAAVMELRKRLSVVPTNTSGVRTAAIKSIGEARYFEDVAFEFQRVLDSEIGRNVGKEEGSRVLNVDLKIGDGIRGSDGLENAWTEICDGTAGGSQGLAFRV